MAAAIPREIWEFSKEDWRIASCYFVLWIILAVIVFIFATRAGNIHIMHFAGKAEEYKYTGISPSDYDQVWLDFSCEERALIAVRDGKYILINPSMWCLLWMQPLCFLRQQLFRHKLLWHLSLESPTNLKWTQQRSR